MALGLITFALPAMTPFGSRFFGETPAIFVFLLAMTEYDLIPLGLVQLLPILGFATYSRASSIAFFSSTLGIVIAAMAGLNVHARGDNLPWLTLLPTIVFAGSNGLLAAATFFTASSILGRRIGSSERIVNDLADENFLSLPSDEKSAFGDFQNVVGADSRHSVLDVDESEADRLDITKGRPTASGPSMLAAAGFAFWLPTLFVPGYRPAPNGVIPEISALIFFFFFRCHCPRLYHTFFQPLAMHSFDCPGRPP